MNDENVLFLNFNDVIASYLENRTINEEFNFIQIGAYDGIMHDPLRKYILKYDWHGILVEPQPGPFKKLTQLYAGNENIKLLNCVISESNGTKELYVIEDTHPSLPDWIRGSASFDKNNLEKFKTEFPSIDENIKTIIVNSISMYDLLNIRQTEFIDLLQIDAEGYDAELLKLFPFEKMKPKIIHFESKNISKPLLETTLLNLLSLNYKIAYDGGQYKAEDIIAVLNE